MSIVFPVRKTSEAKGTKSKPQFTIQTQLQDKIEAGVATKHSSYKPMP